MPEPNTNDFDIDAFLKKRGYDFGAGKTPDRPAAPTTVPSGSAGSAQTPAGGDEPGYGTSLARGVTKSAISTATGAGKLAGQLLPTTVRRTLGQLAESTPGVKRAEEFSQEPYQNVTEGVGGVAGDVATGLMMPEIGIPKLAARMAPAAKVVTQQPIWVNPLGAGGRWMTQNVTRQVQNPTTVARARIGGQIAENAAKGAVGGAAADPNDPVTGAELGALGGLGQRGLGAALRSKYGQNLGDLIARYVPASIAGALVGGAFHGLGGAETGALAGPGIAHGLAHATRGAVGYHSSPAGSNLGRIGRATFDKSGKFLGYVDPVTGGILAGRAAASGVEPGDAIERAKETLTPDSSGDYNPYSEHDYRSGEPRSPASE